MSLHLTDSTSHIRDYTQGISWDVLCQLS